MIELRSRLGIGGLQLPSGRITGTPAGQSCSGDLVLSLLGIVWKAALVLFVC